MTELCSFSCSLIQVFDCLKLLAHLDPLFLPQLMYVCPSHELHELFLLVPTYLSTAYLNKMLSRNGILQVNIRLGKKILYLRKISILQCLHEVYGEHVCMNTINLRGDDT